MVPRRFGRKKVVRRPRRRLGLRGVRKFRAVAPPRVFTEIVQAGDIQVNAGGQFVCKFTDIPQWQQYSQLYKQFCIKKLQVMILPKLNSFDANTTLATGTSYWLPRIAYSVDDTPSTTAPAAELDILTDNGAKVLSMGRKLTLTCWPKPNLASVYTDTGAVVATRQRKMIWLNTTSPDVGNTGVNVNHGAIRYFITANPLYNEYQFAVYYKITFALRDPA